MAYLTTIKIRDLGKRRVVSASAEETEMAPGDAGTAGGWLTLNAEEVTYNLDVMTGDKTAITRFEGVRTDSSSTRQAEIYGLTECDTSGIKVPSWTIRGVCDMTLTSGRKTFAALVKLCKTKGVKEITGTSPTLWFMNYVNFYDDYYCNTLKTAGTVTVTSETTQDGALLSSLYVRVKSFTFPAMATGNQVHWTLVLNETA
jgi:hypothetical protein